MVASALSHCFIGAIFIDKKWSSPTVHGSLWKPKRTAVRASYKEDFQAVKQNAPSFTPSELTLPFASEASPYPTESKLSDSSEPSSEAAAMEADDDLFGKASKALEKMTVAQLAIYGGLIAGGLYLLESILNSFEVLPLLPETLQIVGVLYAILFASRLFQGKPLTLTPSPVKAITELVERRGTLVQKTNLELPQDLDVRVLATMEQLGRERDDAVNKLEVLRRKVADYARVVAEKEALEAVAVQLAQERDEAMSEVIALKQAVDAMSDRMRTVENTLQQDLEPLKQSSQALETVALQLASERDSAMKELSELKEELALAKCKEEEKTALESLASQLAEERDKANLENERLKEILASLPTQESGLSPEQELFLKGRIDAAGVQFMNLVKPYEDQREEVEKFVSHLVEEYGAPSEWTLEYLKRFLKESASESLETSSSSSHPEESASESLETSLSSSQPEESASESLETSLSSSQPEESASESPETSSETSSSSSYESASRSVETSLSSSNPDESAFKSLELSSSSSLSETENPVQ